VYGEEVQICQFWGKLIVGILGAYAKATSNKAISLTKRHELRLKKKWSKTERKAGVKSLSKLTVEIMHKSTVKEYQHTVSSAQNRPFLCIVR